MINLNNVVVYTNKKRQRPIAPVVKPKRDLHEVGKMLDEHKASVKKPEEPNSRVQQLTDKDGLYKAYAAANDISIIYNTLYIASTKKGRA